MPGSIILSDMLENEQDKSDLYPSDEEENIEENIRLPIRKSLEIKDMGYPDEMEVFNNLSILIKEHNKKHPDRKVYQIIFKNNADNTITITSTKGFKELLKDNKGYHRLILTHDDEQLGQVVNRWPVHSEPAVIHEGEITMLLDAIMVAGRKEVAKDSNFQFKSPQEKYVFKAWDNFCQVFEKFFGVNFACLPYLAGSSFQGNDSYQCHATAFKIAKNMTPERLITAVKTIKDKNFAVGGEIIYAASTKHLARRGRKLDPASRLSYYINSYQKSDNKNHSAFYSKLRRELERKVISEVIPPENEILYHGNISQLHTAAEIRSR